MGIKKSAIAAVAGKSLFTAPQAIHSAVVNVTSTETTIIPAAPSGFQNRIWGSPFFDGFVTILGMNVGPDPITLQFLLDGQPMISGPGPDGTASASPGVTGEGCQTVAILPAGVALTGQILSGTGPYRILVQWVEEPDEGWNLVQGNLSDTLTEVVPAPPAGYVTHVPGTGPGSGPLVWANWDTVPHSLQVYNGAQIVYGGYGPTSPGAGSAAMVFVTFYQTVFPGSISFQLSEAVDTVDPIYQLIYRYIPAQT